MNVVDLQIFQHVKWNPDRGELRRFGIVMLCGFAVIGLLLAWRSGDVGGATLVIWGIGIFLAACALIPKLGRLAYLVVYLPTNAVGYVVSNVVLTCVFVFVVVPLAILLRLMKKDFLRLRPSGRRAMWSDVSKQKKVDEYYRQF